jgi:sulfur-carrier protein
MTSVAVMKVLIPTPLRSYTQAREVEASGGTMGELLADLDRRYPGLRFRVIDEQDRMRAHMRFFVNGEQVFDLARPLKPTDDIQIVQALSGG